MKQIKLFPPCVDREFKQRNHAIFFILIKAKPISITYPILIQKEANSIIPPVLIYTWSNKRNSSISPVLIENI